MSLTQNHHVFAGLEESGINTFLKALFTARPHYLRYGSSAFVPVSTVNATNMATIAFPGVPGGIQYAVSFSIPVVDLFPPNAGSGSPIPPALNQFGLQTKVRLTLGCMTWTGNPTGDNRGGHLQPIFADLEVWARGDVIAHYFGPGTGYIALEVLDIRIPAIQPKGFEAIIDCLIRMMLNGALTNVQLPFHAISAGAFQLILEQGPSIDKDEVEVWGNI
jgi:hypothetical protein